MYRSKKAGMIGVIITIIILIFIVIFSNGDSNNTFFENVAFSYANSKRLNLFKKPIKWK